MTPEVSEGLEAAAPPELTEDTPAPEVDTAEVADEAANQPEVVGTEDVEDVPTEYFGQDLSNIKDAEARKAVIEALEEQNRVVNRRLQEVAEARKAQQGQPQPETPATEDELDEEALARAVGLDPSHPWFDELKEFVLPLAKEVLETKESLRNSTEAQQYNEFERQFLSDLDRLEAAHGKLPGEREDVIALAIEDQIANPTALYWSIMGPLQEAARSEIAKKAAEAEQRVRGLKKAVQEPKPRTSAKGSTEKPKGRSLAEMLEAAEETHGRQLTFGG